MIKCELIIDGYSYKITDDVMNWDDVTISLKRGNYDGVVRSFSSKFEFVNTAYSLLKKQYRDNYLGAAASIVISKRNNSWTWNELFRCTLDFSTYEDSGRVISINAVDDTLAAIIKAKKSVQYEYPIADLSPVGLHYDHISLKSKYNFTISDFIRINPGAYPQIYITSYNNEIVMPYLETDTNERTVVCIVQDVPNKGITVSFDVDIYLDDKIIGEFYPAEYVDFGISALGHETFYTIPRGQTRRCRNAFTITRDDFNSNSDKKIYFKSRGVVWDESHYYKVADVYITKINDFSISYDSISTPVNIDILSKSTVANALLESMTGDKSTSVEIIPDTSGELTRLNTAYIMAAESARGIPNAKLYTSFKKYCDWMEAEFGYVYIIDKNIVRFIHRDKLFTSSEIKDLGSNINDFQYSVNSSLIYSSVKVGYDKQDYDSINGRDEFRFINEFATGITLTDNTLSLISPFRADAYGIEFLVQKRGKNTTDNDSDNDVFFVSCSKAGDIMKLYRPYQSNQLSGLISPETMFNLQYSPRFMLEANKSYIAACASLLKFTSSNGNSDVSIAGVKETDDMILESSLFTVGEVEVETSDIDTPSDSTGLVALNNNGEIIRGYIKQLKINVGKEESIKYSLIVKDIKN